MALNLNNKKEIVADVNSVAKSALSMAVAEYRGLDVKSLTSLREKARETNVSLQVVRNTLARKAVVGTQYEPMQEHLVGPLILGFSNDSLGSVAKLFKNFAKENKDLKVKALSLGNEVLGVEHLDAVAALPTREEALSMLLATFKAPVTKFVQTLNEVPTKFARLLSVTKDSKS